MRARQHLHPRRRSPVHLRVANVLEGALVRDRLRVLLVRLIRTRTAAAGSARVAICVGECGLDRARYYAPAAAAYPVPPRTPAAQSQSAPGGAGTASGVGDGQNSCAKSCDASGSADPGGRSCGTSVLGPILGGMSSPWSGAMRIARKDAATC